MRKNIIIVLCAVFSILLLSLLNEHVSYSDLFLVIIICLLVGLTLYVIKNREKIRFKRKVKDKEVKPEELPRYFKFESIIPRKDYIVVRKSKDSLNLLRFIRVVEIPYSIEDMEKDRKLWLMENVARLLGAINFSCRLIHSIKPYDRDSYLRELNRKRENLQARIAVEGSNSKLTTKLKMHDRLIQRLTMGEQAFDNDIVVQLSVEAGSTEESLLFELGKNTKTLQAMLDSNLNFRTHILDGPESWIFLQDLLGVKKDA